MINYHLAREELIDHLERKGIRDNLVLSAMREVRRHEFVPTNLRSRAYEDAPLGIGEDQTISQPYMVARMTELLQLRGTERILEIGTGSGYQSVILAKLSEKVFTVERIASLAKQAKERFERLDFRNIVQKVGDGSLGWREFAPYDGIIVTAGAPEIPSRLVEQLAEGGRMVVPTGPRRVQDLKVVHKKDGKISTTSAGGCIFVPLIGGGGWQE